MAWPADSTTALAEMPPGRAPDAPCTVRANRSMTRERRTTACVLLAAVACFAALAAPFLASRVYVADDLGAFHLPLRNFYAQQLARGEPFDWMPSLYGGFYVGGEGQLGAYHPWHQVLYRFLPLGVAFDVELLASYPLLFAGTYWLLGRLIGRRDAALFGALVFTFGGFSLLHFVHPNAIAVVAHLPWLLVAIDVALTSNGRWARGTAEAGVALLTASQLLLGYPQYVWFSLLAEVAFGAWRFAGQRTAATRLATLLLAVSLGVAAGAVQWIPTLDVLATSTRQTADRAFVNSGSLHPLNLVQLLGPYLFQTRVVGQNTHELGLYAGAVPILLCIWLLASRSRWGRFRPLVRALIVFASLALVLAAGEFGGLYQLQAWVPLAGRFRFPCRAIVLFELCVAAGAAVAAAILLERRTRAQNPSGNRALAAAVLISLLLAVVAPLVWPSFVARPLLVWSGPLLLAVAAGLIVLAQRGMRAAVFGLIVFTALDLSMYGLSYAVVGRTAELRRYVSDVELPPDNGANRRVVAPARPGGPRVGNQMLLAGLTRVDGYAGLEPGKQLDYRQRRAWQLAGVGWAWQDSTDRDSPERTWVRITPTAPRARLVSHITGAERLEDSDRAALDVATVEPTLSLPPSEPGTTRVVADRAGRITIETLNPARQLLVTTESFDAGWTVSVDGEPGGIVRVDGDFLGCPVAAGRHRVQFVFRPASQRLGVVVSICGLGLIVMSGCLGLCFRRHPAAERSQERDEECRDFRSTRS